MPVVLAQRNEFGGMHIKTKIYEHHKIGCDTCGKHEQPIIINTHRINDKRVDQDIKERVHDLQNSHMGIITDYPHILL